jgi:hypothetical protein
MGGDPTASFSNLRAQPPHDCGIHRNNLLFLVIKNSFPIFFYSGTNYSILFFSPEYK